MVILYLIFWENNVLTVGAVALFTFPPAVCTRVPVFPHPHQLVIYCFCCCFNNNHPDECEEVFHCDFDVHFSNDWWCWTSFHVLTGHLYIFFAFCFFDGIVCSMIVRSLAEIHIAYVSSFFLVNILLTVKKRGKINTLQIRSCLLIAWCTWYSFWGWNTKVNKI